MNADHILDQRFPVKPLPELNANYDPPRLWRCATHTLHDCDQQVVGKVGAYPVCRQGAEAEQGARAEDAGRIARLLADPEFQTAIRHEAAIEQAIETGILGARTVTRSASLVAW